MSSSAYGVTRLEAENFSKKISASQRYSIYGSAEGIKLFGFQNVDENEKVYIPKNIASPLQVLAGSDYACVLRNDGTLQIFGNLKRIGLPSFLSNVKEVAGGNDHLLVLYNNGNLQVFGNISLNRRIYGSDRYSTAVELSRSRFASSRYVVIATGENFPDALSAVPLARALNAPLLLSKKIGLPYSVINELQRLRPSFVYIIGGTGVISSAVDDQIVDALKHSPPTRKRIAGRDRYETSVLIAKEIARVKGVSSFEKIYLATGENYPDALSASPLAGYEGFPLLLTKKDELPQTVKDFIKMYRVRKTTIIGGSGVVSDGVVSQVPEPSRIYGKDRYETSVRIAEHAMNKLGFDDSGVYLATGENFPDALSAGVPASLDKNVLLLVSSKLPLRSSTEVFLSNHKQIYKGVVVGGEGAVSQAVVERAFQLTSTNWAGSIPSEIQGKVISIASGEKHVLALTSDGKVYAWGDNLYGQSSVPLEAKSQVVQIACGAFHSLALKENGTVVAWGSNFARQLDIATSGLSDVVKIAAGLGHSVALKSDGRVFVFGDVYINHATGETVYGPNRAVPAVIQGKVIGITCGDSHTLALTEDGFVYGWGNNDYGQAFGPWDYEPEPGAKLGDLGTTFTVEFNVPVSLNLSRIAFRRYDGISVGFNGRVEGNRIYVKPENSLQPNYFYTLLMEKDAVVPAEYSAQLAIAIQLSYSTWKLFAIHGVVYNFTYPWPVFPYIEFFPSAVETTYALYRDSVQVPWTNGSIVREPGNYLLYVWASSNSGEESSVYLNFRLDIR